MHPIESHLAPFVAEEGYRVVFVDKSSFGSGINIAVEKNNGDTPTADECAKLHRLIRAYLTQKNLLKDTVTLEVSSPGLDRPLRTTEDYTRFQGQRVVVALHEPHNNQKTIEGKLLGHKEEHVLLHHAEEEEIAIAFSNIRHCKLIPIL